MKKKKYASGGVSGAPSSSGSRRLQQAKANVKAGRGKGFARGGAVTGLDMAAAKANAAAAPGLARAGGGIAPAGGYGGQGQAAANAAQMGMNKGRGKPMGYKGGGKVTRGDGIAQRGKTRGKLC